MFFLFYGLRNGGPCIYEGAKAKPFFLLIYLLIGMTLLDDVNPLLLLHVLIRARAAHYPHERSEIVGRYDLLRTNEKSLSLSLFLASRVMMTYFLQAGILLLIVKVWNVVSRIDINSTGFPSNDMEKPRPLYIPSVCYIIHDSGSTNEIVSP